MKVVLPIRSSRFAVPTCNVFYWSSRSWRPRHGCPTWQALGFAHEHFRLRSSSFYSWNQVVWGGERGFWKSSIIYLQWIWPYWGSVLTQRCLWAQWLSGWHHILWTFTWNPLPWDTVSASLRAELVTLSGALGRSKLLYRPIGKSDGSESVLSTTYNSNSDSGSIEYLKGGNGSLPNAHCAYLPTDTHHLANSSAYHWLPLPWWLSIALRTKYQKQAQICCCILWPFSVSVCL